VQYTNPPAFVGGDIAAKDEKCEWFWRLGAVH